MSILLERLRKKTQNVLTVTKDESLVEQVHAIKKNLYVDTTLATLLHSNHFDHKWNHRVNNKIQEHVDSLYKNKRHKNIKKTIFEYLDGWVGKEDVDGLLMFVFPSRMGDISYDPKDNKDFDIITNFIKDKIIDVFPLSSGQALALAIEYANPSTFIDWNEGWESLGLKPLNEHKKRELNPKVKPGDHIRIISMDLDKLPPSEFADEYSSPEEYSLGRVDMVYQDETPDGEEVTMLRVYFPELETSMEEEGFGDGYSDISDDGIRIIIDPYDKYVKSDDVLTEAGMIGGGRKPRRNIPDSIRGNLVQAIFTREGGWGRPSQKFIIFMTPMGSIADIQQSSSTSSSNIPFEIDQKISFGDLYRFEQDSEYDLQMKGRLREHDEQLNMFPTGQWDWPKELGDDEFDEEDIEDVKKAVSERQVKFLFNKWDEDGVSFEDLKLLGIPANSSVINALLMKRYILSGTRPLPVSFSFDCEDLANMFAENRDYSTSEMINNFLCGKSYWDFEDWYNYEWDEYMTDSIDENNWKTIMGIFHVDSQSVAEDILNRNSSSEEVDELIEKYEDDIDEIRNFITWVHNDESEWAVKEAFRRDIIDKLEGHFDDGQLFRSDEDDSYSWYFEDDLRNWLDLNDWDNPTKFEFHPDYAGETLENILMQTSPEYITPKVLFEALIKEKYTFEDYDYGAQGDQLEVETKWFDGYYLPDYDINDSLADRLEELTPHQEPINEEEQRVRVRTIYEDDNWKYVWPVNDYSFCQIAKGTEWCDSAGLKVFEGYGTSYILQDKRSDEMWKFDDSEKVPGLPSHNVTIKTKDNSWLDKHRFLADKPTLHDMFQQTYTTFDKMKYGVKLEDTILEDFAETNEFSTAVYNMIINPSTEGEEILGEFLGDNLTTGSGHAAWDSPLINTVLFGNDGVSIYYEDEDFKEKIMGVNEDDDWYFDFGTQRYHDDHCEDMDDEELNYVDYHMMPEAKAKLNDMVTLFGEDPSKYNWGEEGILDEAMQELVPELWENNYWELLDAIGCAVGRSRVKAVVEYVEQDKVLEYEFLGGNHPRLWKLDITYVQLLYIIGDKKINSFSEIEDIEINHIEGNLNDVWYDAWDVDKEGIDEFNYRLIWFIKKVIEEYGEDAQKIKTNRQEFVKVTKELGFQQSWARANLKVEMKVDGGTKTVEIKSHDPKDNSLTIMVGQPTQGEDKIYRTEYKSYDITLDELSEYTLQYKLDLG